jgi:hypothetical protein
MVQALPPSLRVASAFHALTAHTRTPTTTSSAPVHKIATVFTNVERHVYWISDVIRSPNRNATRNASVPLLARVWRLMWSPVYTC